MKKPFFVLLGLLGSGIVFSGCNQGDESTPAPTAESLKAAPRPREDGARAASRELQAALNLTDEQKTKLQEVRRKYRASENELNKKYVDLTRPYQATAAINGRANKPLDPKVKAALDDLMKKKQAELEPLKAKQKEEEQALYTPEQAKVLAEFAQKQTAK
jgi:Spy/CpxP family protein refolding chaperone